MWEQIRAGVAAELLSGTARDEHGRAGTPDTASTASLSLSMKLS